MKLLLVEDDTQLGEALRFVLDANSYGVTWVRSGEDAQRFLTGEEFDLMLLDIVLPRMSGLELLAWTRASKMDLPIIMLTARDTVIDRIVGLDGGADDYLPKPFDMDELFSRCRALLRRKGGPKLSIWTIGALCIDTARRRVTLNQLEVSLSKREFDLLFRLAMSPGQVITRAQLARGSDAEDVFDSNAVDVHIYSLRKKLGGDLISTVRGIGYMLEAK
jgi:DNA-binding response OmpR family regulator